MDSWPCRIALAGMVWLASACGSPESVGSIHGTPASSASDQPDQSGNGSEYVYRSSSRGGTGKFYMGREISHVMGHLGAEWLERPDRQRQERTDLLVSNLPLEVNSIVADIGAGTGYFSFLIAQRVPLGSVLAVDIQPEMLAIIEDRKVETGFGNVEPVLGSVENPNLPDAHIDLILLVDAYHEFSYPREMGQAMARALKPGGQLVLIEYRGEDPSVPIKRLHKMTQKQAIREMQAAGLEWIRTEDFLPQQHFMVFQRPIDDSIAASLSSN